MSTRPTRAELIPNANSPRLLVRLLELISQGVRDPRSLADLLQCELRTVHYYTQAAEWLALLEGDAEQGRPVLTRLGLELVFGGSDRPRVYARAVWGNDLVAQLMAGRHALPDVDIIARFIQQAAPDMAPSTARRRASAVRALIAPALRHLGARRTPSTQLSLDFGAWDRPPTRPPRPELRGFSPESPDGYRVLLRGLLDHGELTLGNLRALLDAAGGRDVALGGLVEMALRRGDAHRVGEALVASWGAVWRRDLAETVAGVALSDPRYREYLRALREAASGHPGAGARYGQLRERFAPWDRRVFGDQASPARLARDLERILLGRSIESFPLAGELGPEPGPATGCFLELLEEEGLVLALPPTLGALAEGVGALNRQLEQARQSKSGAAPPRLVDRRELVHGGLFAPGEAPARAIPDRVSLRLRALTHIPHLAMLTALLLLHRRPSGRRAVRVREGGLEIHTGRSRLGDLLFLLDEFASEQGWLVVRRSRGGVGGETLVEVLESLGVATRLGALVVLDEEFFLRLRSNPEDQLVAEQLQPLAERLDQFLEGWTGT